MREILFRALTNYGNMVFGSLIIDGFGNHFIKESVRDGNSLKENTYNIKPETIGQYTGLTDKNGNKIFDGDMFKPDECNEEVKSIVRYDDEFAKFVIDSYGFDFHIGEGSQEVFDSDVSLLDTVDFGDIVLEYCEIIGNIHDKQSDHEKDR